MMMTQASASEWVLAQFHICAILLSRPK